MKKEGSSSPNVNRGQTTGAIAEADIGQILRVKVLKDCKTQTERFTFLEEGRWVTITVG